MQNPTSPSSTHPPQTAENAHVFFRLHPASLPTTTHSQTSFHAVFLAALDLCVDLAIPFERDGQRAEDLAELGNALLCGGRFARGRVVDLDLGGRLRGGFVGGR